ncbi:hypothetical protein TI05_13995 [Achromatium sp. WMS3]|nr:hypothetical protein TI05_13995 [Achromatium sp. WMS3]
MIAILVSSCGGKFNCVCQDLQQHLKPLNLQPILGTKGFHNLDLAIYIDKQTRIFIATIDAIIQECMPDSIKIVDKSKHADISQPVGTPKIVNGSTNTISCTTNVKKPESVPCQITKPLSNKINNPAYSCPLFQAFKIKAPQQRKRKILQARQDLIKKYRKYLHRNVQIIDVKGCEAYAAKALKYYILETPSRGEAKILFKYYQQCLIKQHVKTKY